MCGNRLNRWKTMPMSRRCRATSLLAQLVELVARLRGSRPARRRRTAGPASIFSRWLMHRRNVDLPDPDGPIRQNTSPRRTSRSMPLSTSTRPKDLWTPSALHHAAGHARAPRQRRSRAAPCRRAASARPRSAGAAARSAAPGSTARRRAPTSAPGTRARRRTAVGHRWKFWPDVLDRRAAAPSTRSTTTSEVVFSMLMTSLPVGGTITRIACGSTIRRSVCVRLHAERVRGLGLALVDRQQAGTQISAMYAASLSPSPSRQGVELGPVVLVTDELRPEGCPATAREGARMIQTAAGRSAACRGRTRCRTARNEAPGSSTAA